MRHVAANLKPLLTCPAFLPWHVLGAVLCIPAFLHALSADNTSPTAYIAAFALPAWSAFVLTSLQRDLLVRPFSFCLPGHRNVLRKTSFLVGIAASLVACVPLLNYSELGGLGQLRAAWSAFCFGLSLYLVAVAFLFSLNNIANALAPFGVMTIVLIEFPATRTPVLEAALFSPGVNSLVLAALSLFVWRRMGSVDLARRSCGRRFLSLQRSWRRSATEEFGERTRREAQAKGTWSFRTRLLKSCFARIGRRPVLSLRRHLAAAQFEQAGGLVPVSPGTLVISVLTVLAVLLAAGYAPQRTNQPDALVANAVYIGVCVLGMHLPVPMFATMLLPIGRRERFWRALALAACSGLLVLGASMLLHTLFLGMSRMVPPFSLHGEVYSFQAADLGAAFIPLAHLPLSIVLKIVCKKWLMVPEILLILTAAFVLHAIASLGGMDPFPIASLLLLSWVVLIAVLYSYSFQQDLIRE